MGWIFSIAIGYSVVAVNDCGELIVRVCRVGNKAKGDMSLSWLISLIGGNRLSIGHRGIAITTCVVLVVVMSTRSNSILVVEGCRSFDLFVASKDRICMSIGQSVFIIINCRVLIVET